MLLQLLFTNQFPRGRFFKPSKGQTARVGTLLTFAGFFWGMLPANGPCTNALSAPARRNHEPCQCNRCGETRRVTKEFSDTIQRGAPSPVPPSPTPSKPHADFVLLGDSGDPIPLLRLKRDACRAA